MKTLNFLLVVFLVRNPSQAIQLGTISYWNNEISYHNGSFDFTNNIIAYNAIPSNSLAVININYGLINADAAHIQEYRDIINAGVKRGIRFLGYIPTAYGNRTNGSLPDIYGSYETLQNQVKLYFSTYPDISGIFFDETENYKIDSKADCQRAAKDMPILREFVKNIKKSAMIAWNPTWIGRNACYLTTALPDELVVVFEREYTYYLGLSKSDTPEHMQIAASLTKKAKTWHIIHSAPSTDMRAVVDKAVAYGADYVYVTNTNSGYKTTPIYFKEEANYIASKRN